MDAQMSQTKSSFRFAQDFGGGLPLLHPSFAHARQTPQVVKERGEWLGAGLKGRLWRRGHFFPGQIRFLFSRVAGWLSVMVVQRVCDESGVKDPAQAKLERGTLQSWDGGEVRATRHHHDARDFSGAESITGA